jgi:hypothetical protein
MPTCHKLSLRNKRVASLNSYILTLISFTRILEHLFHSKPYLTMNLFFSLSPTLGRRHYADLHPPHNSVVIKIGVWGILLPGIRH